MLHTIRLCNRHLLRLHYKKMHTYILRQTQVLWQQRRQQKHTTFDDDEYLGHVRQRCMPSDTEHLKQLPVALRYPRAQWWIICLKYGHVVITWPTFPYHGGFLFLNTHPVWARCCFCTALSFALCGVLLETFHLLLFRSLSRPPVHSLHVGVHILLPDTS